MKACALAAGAAAVIVLVLLAGGCSKGSSEEAPAASASAAAPPVSAPVSAAPSASAPAQAAKATGWRGPYKSVASSITLPKGGNWKVPEVTDGVGEGALALVVEPSGRVTGTVDGVLGPAVVDGRLADDKITAAVRRQDAADHGFTCTLSADLAQGHLRGTMNCAQADVTAVRTATFDLEPGPPPEPAR
jgi:hypothetical protein